ncbi:MAG: 1-deoxy-D-xylulose-5-phosphate synthase [Puniceicoccales bacterium]|jgi:1-deoxy-D-xylulose-5-phosphate synthase|nr:1-deoxy-D-xylulose-5-phosphate synthase [Puniceicoccales bacterium]
MPILATIKNPNDVKKLQPEQLTALAGEIRERIIKVTSENGGHIGPNLGVVELTIALHRVFDTPVDSFIFDVSHQGYVHKLLTGRNGPEFDKLRQSGGLSGFLNRTESEHDAFGAGHAGTALSAALGMATARDLRGSQEHIVAVLGDAALTCGVTLEALNNIASTTKRLVVILNDNEWSIDKNVGAISDYLNQLITTPIYNKTHREIEQFLRGVPGGDKLIALGSRVKRDTKDFITPQASLFEKFKLRYIGPVDGHNIEQLTHYLEFCKRSADPILLHVRTIKGKGCDVALKNPEKFHGCAPFQIGTGAPKPRAAAASTAPAWQDVFGRTLVRCARRDPRVLGITAAMAAGTSLNLMKHELPRQYFDVGIAEEHAVVFAAGLAAKGYKPVCAIYSTFLQRAYDMILHDVCLQGLDVTFCMDRAGLSPNDGATHHGLFDISFLRSIPGAILMQPKDEDELADMVHTAVSHDGPAFVRYPRGAAVGVPVKETPELLPIGKAQVLKPGREIELWALGVMVDDAQALAARLETAFPEVSVGVVNARFAKPLDTALLAEHAARAKLLVTLEDHVTTGGFGTGVTEAVQDMHSSVPVERIGWPDEFVEHGTTPEELRAAHGLSPDAIFERVAARLRGLLAAR